MDGVDQSARDRIRRLEQDAQSVADVYMRKDVYQSDLNLLNARIAEVEKDNIALETAFDKEKEARRADRRLILTSLVLPILVGIIMLYVQSQIGK